MIINSVAVATALLVGYASLPLQHAKHKAWTATLPSSGDSGNETCFDGEQLMK